jgi:DNA-binding CsgD family transcriptional regulator
MDLEDTRQDLIDDIYEAAWNPEHWPTFLSRFADAVQGQATVLMTEDLGRGSTEVSQAVRVDDRFKERYEARYGRNIWLQQGVQQARPGAVLVFDSLVSSSVLKETEFYCDFLRPQGLLHGCGGVISLDARAMVHLCTLRSANAGPFGEAEQVRFKILLPHLQRAFQIRLRIAELEEKQRTSEEALNRLSLAVIAIDQTGRVQSMNRSAHRILSQRDGLRLTSRGLVAEIPSANAELRRVLWGTAFDATPEGVHPERAILVERPSAKRPYVVFVVPSRRRDRGLFGPGASAVIFITDPEARPKDIAEVLIEAFNLTPAEARLAAILVDGKDLNEVCDILSIRRNTGRAHLRSLFDKVGVRRQAELVSVLLRSILHAVRNSSEPGS